MKKIFFLCFFFLIPSIVQAEDLGLKDLQIKNGELSLPFDPYNTEYTVTLDNEEFQIYFDYQVEDDYVVTVENNLDLENDSLVTLNVSKGEEHLLYHFYVLKNNEEVPTIAIKSNDLEEENFMFVYC